MISRGATACAAISVEGRSASVASWPAGLTVGTGYVDCIGLTDASVVADDSFGSSYTATANVVCRASTTDSVVTGNCLADGYAYIFVICVTGTGLIRGEVGSVRVRGTGETTSICSVRASETSVVTRDTGITLIEIISRTG